MADRFGYGEIGLDIHPCRGCEDYDAPDGCKSNGGCGMTQTNADRIRSMTDEDLAEFLCHAVSPSGVINCSSCEAQGFCKMGHNGWLDWLKQEAEK